MDGIAQPRSYDCPAPQSNEPTEIAFFQLQRRRQMLGPESQRLRPEVPDRYHADFMRALAWLSTT